MKNNDATFFIFIASIIIGILITSNFNIQRKTSRVFLNAKQYQEDYSYRNTLVSEVNQLKSKYVDLLNKTSKFQKSNKTDNDIETELKEELAAAKLLSGETDVEGAGISIVIDDGTDKLNGITITSSADVSKIVHNYDLLGILNDLKFAGAEAISINGERIVSFSEVTCSGPFLYINGEEIPSPYIINAIGNKDKLKDYMCANGNYINILSTIRGIRIKVKQYDNLKISRYKGNISYKYLKQSNSK